MTTKKILAAALAAVLALSLAACGNKPAEEPETEPAETVAEVVTEVDLTEADTTEAVAEDTTAAEADETTEAAAEETKADEETEAATEAETEPEKKTPETKAEIVEFYKNAAIATNPTAKGNATMEMVYLDGGSGLVGGLISAFEPIAKKTLAKNSGPTEGITGGFEKLTEADVASATAKDDGKYTTIHINLKDQTDGMNGKSDEGSVGHGVSVLDGVQHAIDELNGVDVDTSEGSVTLKYNKAYIDAKIDNATGKIVSGTWHHTVDIFINNVKAKIGIISATLKDATGQINYTVTM